MLFKRKYRHANKDLTIESLPTNRKEQFFDILKLRYGLLVKIGVYFIIFLLPVVAISLLKDTMLFSLAQQLSNGSIDELTATNSVRFIKLMFSLLYLPSSIVFFIGFSGIVRVIRQLIWEKAVFFKEDFRLGVKQNIKSYLFLGLIVGLCFTTQGVISYFAYDISIVPYIPLAINIAIVFPILLVCLVICSIYGSGMLSCIKTSGILYRNYFPRIILCSLFVLLPLAFSIIPNFIVKYCLILVYVLLIAPLSVLCFYLNELSILDLAINCKEYPEIYKKGLNNKKESPEK